MPRGVLVVPAAVRERPVQIDRRREDRDLGQRDRDEDDDEHGSPVHGTRPAPGRIHATTSIDSDTTFRAIGKILASIPSVDASLAHELNQPLTAILNNAQVAQRFLAAEVVDIAELRETLDDIVADDKRAADVIRRLRRLLKKGDTRAPFREREPAPGSPVA
ncbi:MAG: hypothetical protein FJZ38_08915 [Candidatus Rokubacteria bacterium]|nr:hypothetical protein [Candidatus Rokubacteria bacterium]